MWRNHPKISGGLLRLAHICLSALWLASAEQRGQVLFNGLPVPGVTVVASQNGTRLTTTTDTEGAYSFPGLPDGSWSFEVQMPGFAHATQQVVVQTDATPAVWNLKLLALEEIEARSGPEVQSERLPEDLNQHAAEELLINGSINNGAASPFAQTAAFGNTRSGTQGLYNGGIGLTFENSLLDARSFSLTGEDTPKPAYNRVTGLLALGGPLRIPHVLRNGPDVFVGYQWTRNRNATTDSALVPDGAQRAGDGIPLSLISPRAQALLNFYPLPNITSSAGYNYQTSLLSPLHQDSLQARVKKSLSMKDQFNGSFALQSTRADNPSLFHFLDTSETLGMNSGVNWFHRFNHHLFVNLGYQFSRFSTRVTPYFEDRTNVSGLAGIGGNNQDSSNWGPPALVFSSGIASLSDVQSSFNRDETNGVSSELLWNRNAHTFRLGGGVRRKELNNLGQQDPRGTFTFTGAATGSDFGDFLLGIPDASSIAFGNADKYYRESVYNAYINDDWRINSSLSVNAGVRWDYGAPMSERYGRLVNLDIAPGFAAVAPVVGTDPIGPLRAQQYPRSLVRPDRLGIEPRAGLAWRPQSGSSMVIRAGYGVYDDTSVYQAIATQMSQQAPLSKSLSVQNTPGSPLTLAHGFIASPLITRDTFGIDPNFRVGYAQIWQGSIQRDLPGALQVSGTYLGTKGTRGRQESLPNTYAPGTYQAGAVNACLTCPSGFTYLESNGNSNRESAQVQVRRRLHNGVTGTVEYTFSKSLDDDAALGGQGASGTAQGSDAADSSMLVSPSQPNLQIAQNWRNLSAERSLSTFDQRHLLTVQLQYTTGMGAGGGTLLSGWKGGLFKEWTFATEITAGSGLPETPVELVPVPGTGVTGTMRPEYTGASLYEAAGGRYLNPAAYEAPPVGQWGNAARNSITGPAQFVLNASLGRTFRLTDRLNLGLRIDSTNALNHVTFTAWNTITSSTQFGLPVAANEMRSMQTTLRLRF